MMPDDAPPAALTALAVLLSMPTADGAALPAEAKVRILHEVRRGVLSMARALEVWADELRAEANRRGER